MVNYCPNCGKKAEEDYKFCPACGNDIKNKLSYCPLCGKKLTGKMFFCDTCTQPISGENKPQIQTKPEKIKTKHQGWPFQISRKKLFLILGFIILIIIVGAVVVVFNPFNLPGEESQNRTFTVTIENIFNKAVFCQLKVNNLLYGSAFTVSPSETVPITISEQDLFIKRPSYPITLYVTYNEIKLEATADAVTESVIFNIVPSTELDPFTVVCTEYT